MKSMNVKQRKLDKLWVVVSAGLLGLFAAAANASPSLTVGVSQGLAGQTVNVPVTFQNNNAVASAQFDIQYDATQLTAGTPLAGAGLTTTGHGLSSSHIAADTLRIVITPPTDNAAIDSGTVVEIPFTIATGANSSSKTLVLANFTFFNDQALPAPADKLINGLIVTDLNGDTDGDNMSDGWEYANGLNATDAADAAVDSDGDGVSNYDEYLAGTDPWSIGGLADSDGDGVPDSQDAFPFNVAEWLDTDGDGIGNNADPDDDGDGMPDSWELVYGFDPLDASDAPLDFDGDGLTNLTEFNQGSDPTVSDLSAYATTVLSDNPVAYWRMNEASGTTASDVSGNGYDGAYTGTVTLGASGLLSSSADTAISLAGSGYISGTNPPLGTLEQGDFTIEAWVTLDDLSQAMAIFDQRNTSTLNGNGSLQYRSETGKFRFDKWPPSDGSFVSTTSPQVGQTYHIAYTEQGTTRSFYINGVLDAQDQAAEVYSGQAMDAWAIGARSDGPLGWRGVIDEVAVYNTALTAAQIQHHYNVGTGDGDGDGMPDDWETANGLNPNDASDATLDGDTDGLTNLQEFENNTDPANWDSDADGMADGWEVQYGLDPLNSADAALDLDGDGIDNLTEYQQGSDPTLQEGVQEIVWTDLVGVTADGGTLTKTASLGWGNGGAASQQIINGDGAVEFTVAAENIGLMFGLSYVNADASWESIDYAIQLTSSSGFRVQENGVQKGEFGSYYIGDVLRVEREGSTIHYKRNGVVFYSSLVPSSGSLIADVSINTSGAQISNAKIYGAMLDTDGDLMEDSWETANGLNPNDASDATLDGDTDGLTNLQEFENNTDPANWDSDADGMADGWEVQYGLDPLNSADAALDLDGDGIDNLTEYQQGSDPTLQEGVQEIVWTDLVGVTADGGTLTKTASLGWGNGGAASQQIINGDGAVEFTVAAENIGLMFGLSYVNADASWESIDYAIQLTSSSGFRVQENGVQKGEFGSYYIGDVLRVEREGSTIHYKRNGVVFYSSLVPSSGSLIADVSINTSGAQISNAKIYGAMLDTDGDLMEDSWETANGLNPNDASDATLDGDTDGLTNLQEFENNTDPANWDSDADGMADGWEVQYGLDPLNSADAALDLDGDGIDNLTEYQQGSDPTQAPLSAYESAVISDNPVAYWRMNEASGTTASDVSGNGYDGAYTGTVTLGASGLLPSSADTAISLAGSGYISGTNPPLGTLEQGDFTIEAWVTLDDLSQAMAIFDQRNTSTLNGNGSLQYRSETGKFRFDKWPPSDGSFVSTTSPQVGQTYHIAYTEQGTTRSFYINGVLDAQDQAAEVYSGQAMDAWAIGARSDGPLGWRGVIDEVAVYGAALTASQVLNHYQVGVGQ